MPVNAKSVQGRRELNFQTLDEVVADAETLVASPKTRTIGNWPLSQLLSHLASTVENSMDGFPTKAPLLIRIIGPFIKSSVISKKMGPGIKLPKYAEEAAYPAVATPQAALDRLRTAVARTKKETMNAVHPAFGKMTHEEWNKLHLRHSELHLSYAVVNEK